VCTHVCLRVCRWVCACGRACAPACLHVFMLGCVRVDDCIVRARFVYGWMAVAVGQLGRLAGSWVAVLLVVLLVCVCLCVNDCVCVCVCVCVHA